MAKNRRAKAKTPSRRNLSTAQIAELLDLDPATVLRWTGEGLPHDKSSNRKLGNRYDVAEVQAWMKTNRRTGDVGRPLEAGSDELKGWKVRREKAIALKFERENAIEEGKLIDAETERKRDLAKITVARNRLLGLGAAIAPKLEGLDGAQRQGAIDTAVAEILADLAAS